MLPLSDSVSRKMRFFSFVSMLLLVFVHGYNLNERYLQPWSFVGERMTLTAYVEYFLANGIFRFRIPMLFIISGYLFALHDNASFGKRIGKRVRTLLVPYFLWSAIGLMVAVVLYHWNWTRVSVLNTHLQPTDKTFDQYTFSNWLQAIIWPTSYQLWFIRSLFFYNLLFPVLKAGVLKAPKIVFPILVLLWVSHFGFFVLEGEGMLSFSLGIWLCKRNKNVAITPKWFSLRSFTILFFGLTAIKTWLAFNGLRFMSGMPLSITLMLMHRMVVATGLLVAWYGLDHIADGAMRTKWFAYLSGFSFIIYALHVPLITYLIDPVHSIVHAFPYYRAVTFLLLPICVIAFCILIGWLLRSLLPAIYSLLTGNRGTVPQKSRTVPAKPIAVAEIE